MAREKEKRDRQSEHDSEPVLIKIRGSARVTPRDTVGGIFQGSARLLAARRGSQRQLCVKFPTVNS